MNYGVIYAVAQQSAVSLLACVLTCAPVYQMAAPCAILPRSLIQSWEDEIAAMKPRKAKNWKTKVPNCSGQLDVVRYVPEGVQVDVPGGERVHFVLKTSDWDKNANRKFQSKGGTVVGDWIPIVPADSVVPSAEAVADNPRVAQAILDGTWQEELRNIVDENATGNHGPRNHRIGVPTRAGEPVRG